jgi:PAS domain S-box-containing protein
MSLNDADHESGLLRAAGAAMLRGEDYFREVLEALPAGIYITDNSGRIIFYNHAAAKLWGRDPKLGTTKWCGSWKLFWSDGTPLPPDECPMALAIRECRSIRGAEGIIERPDGSRIPFVPYPTPLFDEEGTLVGAVNMFVDITDRKRSEEVDRRLASIVENCDDAIISKDSQGIITSWNRGAERLFGYSTEEVIGKPITILIPPDRADEERTILDRLRRGERIDHFETVRRRKDGSLVDIFLTVSPVRDAGGKVIGASKIARDITERKRNEAQINILAREAEHRAKNVLATVQATVQLSQADTPEGLKHAIEGRIHALANVHRLFVESRWAGADIQNLIKEELAAYSQDREARVQINGPSVLLEPEAAQAIAVTLHELATNAAKYGALSVPNGRVQVEWTHERNGRVVMRWTETGGPCVRPPTRKGFGTRVIERMIQTQLNGELRFDWRAEGLACEISTMK